MGDWQALRLIGVHTGDGSRYVAEATKRADDGELSAISSLAWIYYSGNFVPVDYPKAISLYEEYISKANNQYKNKKNEAHKRLYSIYQELDNVKEAEKHKRYLDENDDINANE
jgi:TPR repeat protein